MDNHLYAMDAAAAVPTHTGYSVKYLPFEATHTFKDIFLDYLEGSIKLGTVLGPRPTLASLEKIASEKSYDLAQKKVLVDVLTEQYETIGIQAGQVLGLAKLSNGDAFTVTTGHQLCIYLGPLYTVLKAITVIKLAEKMEAAYPHRKIVPIFWLAGEDHDLEEISHLTVEGQTYHWHPRHTGPAGQQSLEGLKETLAHIWPRLPAYLDQYTKFSNLVQAQAWLLHQLFGHYGLVVINPDDRRLKAVFSPIILKELTEEFVKPAVERTTAHLEASGYKGQISVRDINLFLQGPYVRERIVQEAYGNFSAGTLGSFSRDELLQMAMDTPEVFSPNVALRPVYQEMLLPNLAYIGGPAEVAYWLQLHDVFAKAEVAMPAVWPRAHALLISTKETSTLEKLGLEPEDLFLDLSTLKKKVVALKGSDKPDLQPLTNLFEKYLQSLEKLTLAQDPSLVQYVAAEKARMMKQMQPGHKRLEKAYVRRFEELTSQAERLHNKLTANGGLQERSESYLTFVLQDKDLIDNLYHVLDATSQQFQVITYSQEGSL
jgi:bacillithiol biosynthesis cysteine-adding enzyme BshC